MDMSLSKLQRIVKDREAWHAAIYGIENCQTTEQLNNNNPSHKLRQSGEYIEEQV